jgi:hypothetical protein
MASKKVTFPSGKKATVYSVPQKYYDEIRMAFPNPPVPILESDATATGEVMRYENRQDPDYKAACEEMEQKRKTKWLERLMVRGLRDIRPPDGWQVSEEQIAESRYFTESPEWQPRQGETGRILDYIEYEFFESPGDSIFFMDTVNELSDVPEEAVDAIEATFRGDVEVQQGGEADTD